MLDAFIIDRIHREREAPTQARVPLRIEIPAPAPPAPGAVEVTEDRAERGVVDVDFTI